MFVNCYEINYLIRNQPQHKLTPSHVDPIIDVNLIVNKPMEIHGKKKKKSICMGVCVS
jgi:hypothetical protein